MISRHACRTSEFAIAAIVSFFIYTALAVYGYGVFSVGSWWYIVASFPAVLVLFLATTLIFIKFNIYIAPFVVVVFAAFCAPPHVSILVIFCASLFPSALVAPDVPMKWPGFFALIFPAAVICFVVDSVSPVLYLSMVFAIIVLMLIRVLLQFRSDLDTAGEQVEALFFKHGGVRFPSRIIRDAISILNRNVRQYAKCAEMYCLDGGGADEYAVVASSSPALKAVIFADARSAEKLDPYRAQRVAVDGEDVECALIVPIAVNDKQFTFIIQFVRYDDSYHSSLIVRDYSLFVCKRLAYFLYFSTFYNKKYHEILSEAARSYRYVQKARKVLHYLRNMFTPIQNFITLAGRCPIDAVKCMDERKATIHKKERLSALSTLDRIVARANGMLDDYDAFDCQDLMPTEVGTIIHSIKEAIDSNGVDTQLDLSLLSDQNWAVAMCVTSSYQLEGLFHEIVNNIKTHGVDSGVIQIYVSSSCLSIVFANKFAPEKYDALQDIVLAFESASAKSGYPKKSHGLDLIHQFAKKAGAKATFNVTSDYSFYTTVEMEVVSEDAHS